MVGVVVGRLVGVVVSVVAATVECKRFAQEHVQPAERCPDKQHGNVRQPLLLHHTREWMWWGWRLGGEDEGGMVAAKSALAVCTALTASICRGRWMKMVLPFFLYF